LASHTEDDIIIHQCQTEEYGEIARSPRTVKKVTPAEKKHPTVPMRETVVKASQKGEKKKEGDGMERHISSSCPNDKRI
jgi:hypothetical protein